MKSCMILGMGRSGTSLLAGTLREAGYYMGERLLPGNDANPKGFFEDLEIIAINEAILLPITPSRPGRVLMPGEDAAPVIGWRWLTSVPVGAEIPCPPPVAGSIREKTARGPFCFKDPRFCYTLPAWRPSLADAAFACVFREPERTARSILTFCRVCQDESCIDRTLDYAGVMRLWTLMYRHVVETHRRAGDWLFVHYDQLVDGSALPRLAELLGARVDARFPDPSLKRSPRDGDADAEALAVYERLCGLAGFVG